MTPSIKGRRVATKRVQHKELTSLQHLLSRHGSGYNEIRVSKHAMAGSGAYVLFGSLFASMGICKSNVPLMNDLHSTQCPEPDIFDLYGNLERLVHHVSLFVSGKLPG